MSSKESIDEKSSEPGLDSTVAQGSLKVVNLISPQVAGEINEGLTDARNGALLITEGAVKIARSIVCQAVLSASDQIKYVAQRKAKKTILKVMSRFA
jgi:hypothetical protein